MVVPAATFTGTAAAQARLGNALAAGFYGVNHVAAEIIFQRGLNTRTKASNGVTSITRPTISYNETISGV